MGAVAITAKVVAHGVLMLVAVFVYTVGLGMGLWADFTHVRESARNWWDRLEWLVFISHSLVPAGGQGIR